MSKKPRTESDTGGSTVGRLSPLLTLSDGLHQLLKPLSINDGPRNLNSKTFTCILSFFFFHLPHGQAGPSASQQMTLGFKMHRMPLSRNKHFIQCCQSILGMAEATTICQGKVVLQFGVWYLLYKKSSARTLYFLLPCNVSEN